MHFIVHLIVSRIHENSEAKKGSRFSFSVDSLLSTVAQTKKPPTPTYSMIFFYYLLLKYVKIVIVSRIHENYNGNTGCRVFKRGLQNWKLSNFEN